MFDFFKRGTGKKSTKKPEKNISDLENSQSVVLKINGMHCSSCSLNIDGELEDTDGVISASTVYATAQTTVTFDAQKISEEQIKSIISSLGYTVD